MFLSGDDEKNVLNSWETINPDALKLVLTSISEFSKNVSVREPSGAASEVTPGGSRGQPDGGKLHPYYNIQIVFSAKGTGRRSVRGIAG